MEKIAPIRNELAHGEYYNDVDLVMLESMDATNRQKSKKYEESVKRLLLNSVVSIHGIELMLSVYLKLVYKQLLPIRREVEKQKATANNK